MLKDLFKKSQYATVSTTNLNNEIVNERLYEQKPNIPTGMWNKCSKCNTILYAEDLEKNYNVCTNCGFHFRIGARERISTLVDGKSFHELFKDLKAVNKLDFNGYEEKLSKSMNASGLNEAVVTGIGKVSGHYCGIAVMDSAFMMGSMGSAVGEKITRLIEYCTEIKAPVIIFTASGGARMQEGIFSLMQMAKVSAAIGKHDEKGLLYITVITNPTTGGVTASFAMEGDIILSEPGALIGFAGRRVIENTIKEKLPDYFQTAEFALEKGFIDKIVERKAMKECITKILKLHEVKNNG